MSTSRELKRCKTYIPGFDLISNGGLPVGRTTLVSGGPGSAKTILAAQFLAEGIAKAGEPGCFVTFEEQPADIRRNLSSFGWDIEKWENENKWAFVDGSLHPKDEPVVMGDYDLGGLMARIDHAVQKIGARRVSLDSIGAILVQFGMPVVIRRELYRVAWQLREMGVTSIITAEHTGQSEAPVEEYVTDNVIIGMGLPCSALSQARRVDVYSWQSPTKTWWTYLDAHAIAKGTLVQIPTPKAVSTPARNKTGTLVVLSDCDRVDLRSPATVDSIKRLLGRIFRRAILRGAMVTVNGELVRPVDPLFRDATHPVVRGKRYGPQLDLPVRTPNGVTSIVHVRFTELPVEKLSRLSNAEKADAGITKGAGVSVVRAGREIDYGWFFMGAKRKENYDDWWRCEVEFEPALDELFGLTHTKQRVHPTPSLLAVLAPHLESIARMLNRRVRDAFQRIASLRKDSTAARRAESHDAQLEPPSIARRPANAKTIHVPGIAGLRYKTCRSPLPNGEFFNGELAGKVLTMTINTNHAFHDQLIAPLLQHRVVPAADAVAGIELLLLAYCRAETSLDKREERMAQRLRQEWADALSAYIG